MLNDGESLRRLQQLLCLSLEAAETEEGFEAKKQNLRISQAEF